MNAKNRIRTSDYWSYYDVLYRIQLCDHRKVDIGPIEINKQQNHPVQWSPILGVVLIIGGVVLIVQDKK
jgi:hypothetical protein